MTFDQLVALVWVARSGGFGSAARKLNATQPGISTKIRKLEQELGCKLFERNTKNVRLTRKGMKCVEISESIMKSMNEIRHATGNSANVDSHLSIGASESVAMTWLPGLLEIVKTYYPKVEIDLYFGPTPDITEKLNKKEIDLALVCGDLWGLNNYQWTSLNLGYVKYVWVAAEKYLNKAGKKDTYTVEDFRNFSLISYSNRSFLRSHIDDWLQCVSTVNAHYMKCDSLPLILRFVESAQGVAPLPEVLVKGDIEAGRLVKLETVVPMPTLDCNAIFSSTMSSSLPREIADLACDASTFERRNLRT